MRSDVIDMEVWVHARTDRAILVSETGDRDAAEWLPLAQIEIQSTEGAVATVTLPEWLAIDRGLA